MGLMAEDRLRTRELVGSLEQSAIRVWRQADTCNDPDEARKLRRRAARMMVDSERIDNATRRTVQ